MKKKPHNVSKRKLLLTGMAFFSVCAILFYILYCTKAVFHSDMAYWLLLADEQIRNHQFFPDGFYYTTGVVTVSTEVLVLLLRLFCQNWLLCREIAVIIITFAVFVLIFHFYKATLSGNTKFTAALISLILLCLPMNHYMETFYSAAYEWQLLWDMLIMLILSKILAASEKETSRNSIKLYVLLFAIFFFCSLSGVKSLLYFTFPLLLAIPVFHFIQSGFCFECIFKNKRHNAILFVSIPAAILGVSIYLFLAKSVSLSSVTGYMMFAEREKIIENFSNLLVNIIGFYSALGSDGLVSIGGISACINFVVMVFCTIIAPITMIVRYPKTTSTFWKIYTIYAWISNLIILYTLIFTDPVYIRYYELIFWHNIVLTSVFLADLIRRRGKYYESFIYAVLAVVFVFGHAAYVKETVLPIHDTYVAEETDGTLIDFLKENDLDYGFASFWHAYKYMALSNGDIMLISCNFSPLSRLEWMSSASYFDVDTHPGRCFILVDSEETIDTKYDLAATEIKQFQNYKILIYEKNIFLYDELAD